MEIAIIGGGAVGLLTAYFLEEDYEVTIYVRSIKQLQELSNKGLCYKRGDKKEWRHINIDLFQNWQAKEEITFVTVKQYHLEAIYKKINDYATENNGFIFMQNGMSHLQEIKKLKTKQIMVGIVEHGAVKVNDYTVEHLGVGSIKLAALHSFNSFLKILVGNKNSFFAIQEEKDYFAVMQKKLVVNSLVNPLTSILGIKNGALLENTYFYGLITAFMEEIATILNLSEIEKKDYFFYCVDVIKKTANNKSSMLKDIEEKRKTEVDSILGYLLLTANKRSISAKLTESYYNMVKGKESN
ncbi:ketopantoate reductase family protein [Niallia sp. NCCP-28]|uniref:ketopantoate reductase family protein n=1 Tax=Niallia sp. NCCP-28 TaxID=2934712 RepID=UPI002082812B|nr:2-dehydropantoate 2-reductase [Niallia sp. NCCP-28]GKU82371.1 2-dehydropantoate 2-reductase [Niallia sp. NCCP-28]